MVFFFQLQPKGRKVQSNVKLKLKNKGIYLLPNENWSRKRKGNCLLKP